MSDSAQYAPPIGTQVIILKTVYTTIPEILQKRLLLL